MKLYLSSYRLGSNSEKLAELFGENKKVAVVANAIDDNIFQERKEKLEKELSDLQTLHLKPEELDLRDYFGKEKELQEKLSEFDGVWIRGGNTFILRRAFAYSGFDTILQKKKHDKDFVYGGYSAGICILAPDLHGLDIVDPPDIVPNKYQSKIMWEGLGILPFHIAPHYKSDHPESTLVDKEVAYLKKHHLSFKTLRDGDVLIEEI